jgi:hypothetical protein
MKGLKKPRKSQDIQLRDRRGVESPRESQDIQLRDLISLESTRKSQDIQVDKFRKYKKISRYPTSGMERNG